MFHKIYLKKANYNVFENYCLHYSELFEITTRLLFLTRGVAPSANYVIHRWFVF